MALLFTGQYFHRFHEKVAFRENRKNKIANVHQNRSPLGAFRLPIPVKS